MDFPDRGEDEEDEEEEEEEEEEENRWVDERLKGDENLSQAFTRKHRSIRTMLRIFSTNSKLFFVLREKFFRNVVAKVEELIHEANKNREETVPSSAFNYYQRKHAIIASLLQSGTKCQSFCPDRNALRHRVATLCVVPHARKYRSQDGAESDAGGLSVGCVELPAVVVVVAVYSMLAMMLA
ncbi:hypothetical protein V1478_011041 [Vespula squamosa]|uniref:Uncharacterized protein n=1 Tax=Vespula squamosa TaxID=30214 RepID=A0ABD2AG60_VESSQ